ncbi:glucokinase [Corynebacterium sp. 13CS0277]|uniref:ROK family glucokinase n=1 Tax=Corynebacterium sp. 13CS0277 TaxID=2071994 RepID=UPI000D02954C|nr:ROK family glucokinase [Corynebacterium sp. 13CS0277]PRQ11134.1 glucokinase [Corynebacterium sp. 13CS0277]
MSTPSTPASTPAAAGDVVPPAAAPLTIGFDIGGTNLRGGVVDAEGRIIAAERRPTPATGEELNDAIVDVVESLRASYPVAAVGLAVAGFLNATCDTVRFAPHLPWRQAPVKDILQARLGMPVVLEHDANAAAWGEYTYGAARGQRQWSLFAVGTGIGGAIVIDGTILRGAFGTAGEFGHITAVPSGRPCSCGKSGCLERYCSGTALATTAAQLLAEGTAPSTLRALPREQVTGAAVMAACREGDEVAVRAVDDFAHWMGRGFALVADILDPGMIVLGGGVVGDADLFLPTATRVMGETMVGAAYRPKPEIAVAQLGSRAGLVGVADLAHRALAQP